MASAALAAASFGAPMTGLAQGPPGTTTATRPEPPPNPAPADPQPTATVPAAEPTVTAPEPPPAVPEPAPEPAPAPAASNPPPLFMPDLPRRSLRPIAPAILPDLPADDQRRRAENALGTNREPAPEADGGTGEGELGTLLPATGAADVPSFFIDSFGVPPFLLPIYQAAGIEYGVPWEILAAINAIETDYGRNLNVSSAGAVGWMQFLPSTFAQFGVDGSGDRRADPYNPVDAIFSAANYLRAAGIADDLSAALFAYNHSDAYVAGVLSRARLLGGLPSDLVDALSGLAQGRPPVAGTLRPLQGGAPTTLRLRTKRGADVVAVADGVVERIGRSSRLGRYLRLRDVFGNTYTYGELGRTARRYRLPAGEPRPPAPPAASVRRAPAARLPLASTDWKLLAARSSPAPARPATPTVRYRQLRAGSRVIAGTTVAYAGAGAGDAASGRVAFEIRPAGRGAPRIEPRPFVAGWRLLRRSAPSASALATAPAGIGRVLLLDKRELQRAVLADKGISLAACGRRDIRAGHVDRRVLGTLKFLALSGLRPTVSASECGDGAGAAIDIVAVNGVPIAGNQGPGSIAEATIQRLLQLQGALRPQQIISLHAIAGAPTTVALPDHADHIHVGFTPAGGATTLEDRNSDGIVPASSWQRLSRRLSGIANPAVAPGRAPGSPTGP
jgi:hypothetical protein